MNTLPGPSSEPDNVPAPVDNDREVSEQPEEEEESCEPKLKSFKEAMQYMEEVLCFLDHRGCTLEANQVSQLLDSVSLLSVQSKTWKQTCVTDYYN